MHGHVVALNTHPFCPSQSGQFKLNGALAKVETWGLNGCWLKDNTVLAPKAYAFELPAAK